jgi:hypothetical protein
MRIICLFIACCWLTAFANPTTPLTVTTTYRVTEVKPSEKVFGIALMTDDPHVTQNDVYPEDHTVITKKVGFGTGMVKEFPVTRERFFQLVSPGDVVEVEGHRNFDMSIEADKIRLIEK